MRLTELDVTDERAAELALAELHGPRALVMLQMPPVFTLLAPATPRGIAALDATKQRLPAKNYGSAIGSLERFHALVLGDQLPDEFTQPSDWSRLEGAFIRLCVAAPDFHSSTVRAGTHQGLLLAPGPHRSLLTRIEESFANSPAPELFGGKHYTAPLCTSANLSGDPLGSITDEARAHEFALSRDVRLLIRCAPASGEQGSYPIFFFRRSRVSIERPGPGMQQILARIPASVAREGQHTG